MAGARGRGAKGDASGRAPRPIGVSAQSRNSILSKWTGARCSNAAEVRGGGAKEDASGRAPKPPGVAAPTRNSVPGIWTGA